MSGEVIRGAAERGVVPVTLRHAGRLNAMSRAMWRQLREVFLGIQQQAERGDESVRCVLNAGEGRAFCAGGDISEYPVSALTPLPCATFTRTMSGAGSPQCRLRHSHRGAHRWRVHGRRGGDRQLRDIRIAGSSARFGARLPSSVFRWRRARRSWWRRGGRRDRAADADLEAPLHRARDAGRGGS